MRERGEGFIEKQIDLTLRERALTILMTITVIHDDEGKEMGMAVVFEDLTQYAAGGAGGRLAGGGQADGP